jgi:hypothetical protein
MLLRYIVFLVIVYSIAVFGGLYLAHKEDQLYKHQSPTDLRVTDPVSTHPECVSEVCA